MQIAVEHLLKHQSRTVKGAVVFLSKLGKVPLRRCWCKACANMLRRATKCSAKPLGHSIVLFSSRKEDEGDLVSCRDVHVVF